MSDYIRHGHLRTERQKSCPESTSYSSSSSNSSKERSNGSKGTGKRFARRAKRWAELQNRRSGINGTQRNGPPELPRVCDFVELARMGSGVIQASEASHFYIPSSGRRSLPFSILQPRRQECHVYYPPYEQPNQPYYVPRDHNDFRQHTYISVYHTAPELTVYPVHSTNNQNSRSSLLSSEPSSPDSVDTLSLLTADLCATSISSPSSLSTSISSQEAEDFMPYPRSHLISNDYNGIVFF